MDKKGAELSLNVIIVAVILLIVLVVLVIIFSGKLGLFTKSSEETSAPFKPTVCDVPGTGRYCSDQCFEGDTEEHLIEIEKNSLDIFQRVGIPVTKKAYQQLGLE